MEALVVVRRSSSIAMGVLEADLASLSEEVLWRISLVLLIQIGSD